MEKIPLVDLKAQYFSLKPEIDAAIQNVVLETAFIRGRYVERFEKEFATALGVEYCVSCGNGTDALYITLKALGIGPGDEVITVANTWISTAETVSQTGARPVFVDIHPDYFTIDPDKIPEKITPRTKAIIPVHLFGQPADLDRVTELCRRFNLALIEDCAQSHLATWRGRPVGTFGVVGTFSFYPGKNLGAYGDAGAIVTNNPDLARKAKMFANHGALSKHDHLIEGINSRMDGIQGAILSVKLSRLRDWNLQRRAHARAYLAHLEGVPQVVTPKKHLLAEHVYHLFVIRCPRRDQLRQFLCDRGIETGIHYPMPLPFLQAYAHLGYVPGDFPVADAYKSQILSLPMYPELKENQVQYVAASIAEFYDSQPWQDSSSPR